MTITSDYTELRDKQQKVWSSGDYNRIAHITVPVSEHLVDHVGVMPGTHVLDVATGTGHVALAAARRGAVVHGIDYVPELLDIARRRADAEDLDIEFAEADAEKLPYGDGSFDTVFSAIGVMFAADHARAASELVRVARKGGRIALASWTPEGFVGGMLAAVGRHVSPPPGAQPATRWGVEAVVAELLGDGVAGRAVGDRHGAPALPQRRGLRRPVPHLLRPDVLRGQPARRGGPRGVPRRPGRARARPSTRAPARASCATGSTASSPRPSADTHHTNHINKKRKQIMNIKSISSRTKLVLLVAAGLIVASTTTAGAAALITGQSVKNESLTGRDIRNGSLKGADIRDGSLTKDDFSGALAGAQGPAVRRAAGPKGADGRPGRPGAQAGPQGAQGPAGFSGLQYVIVGRGRRRQRRQRLGCRLPRRHQGARRRRLQHRAGQRRRPGVRAASPTARPRDRLVGARSATRQPAADRLRLGRLRAAAERTYEHPSRPGGRRVARQRGATAPPDPGGGVRRRFAVSVSVSASRRWPAHRLAHVPHHRSHGPSPHEDRP